MLYSRDHIAKHSRFLIGLAWTVEVIAVLIGLTISVVVAVSAYNSFAVDGGAGLLDGTSAVLVASLPFVLIAVVELCKIPLTFAFMSIKHIAWRTLFLCFVIFLCLITFETLLNGFERNFSNLNRAIDVRKNDIENTDSEIALLENRRDYVVKFTEADLVGEVDASRSEIDGAFGASVRRIDQDTQKVLAGIDYSFKPELEAEIARLQDVLDGYYKDWREETAAVEERFSSLLLNNISGSSEERERLLGELNALKAEFEQSMATANFFNRGTRETKYRALIAEKENQLAQITTGYLGGRAIEQQSSMEGQLKSQLEFVNNKYSGRVDDVNARIEGLKQEIDNRLASNANLESSVVSKAASDKSRFARIRNAQNSELDQYRDRKLTELEEIAERSFGIDEQIFALRNQQRQKQTEINHLINQNQIYRLAMYAFDKESPSDVSRGEAGIVALIWFGSLALIAAVCGVMLALAGYYLRRFAEPPPTEEEDPQGGVTVDMFVDGPQPIRAEARQSVAKAAAG